MAEQTATQRAQPTRDAQGRFQGRADTGGSTNVSPPSLGGMMQAMQHRGNAAQALSTAKPQPAQQPPQQQQPATPPPVVGVPNQEPSAGTGTAPTQTDAPPVSSPIDGERQTQPEPGQSVPAAESVEEARIPYDRFKEVNDKYNTLKTSSDEQILAMKKERDEARREAEVLKLKSQKPPDNFEEMSAWEQLQYFQEQQLKMQQLTSESPASATENTPQPDPRVQKLLLKDDLGLTSNAQADLVFDMQQQHPSLSAADALALAKAQSPDSFSSPTANGTVPPASFRSTPQPSAPAPDQRAGAETPEQALARSEREMQEAFLSGNRQVTQAAAISHFDMIRKASGGHQMQQRQPPQAPPAGGQPQQ